MSSPSLSKALSRKASGSTYFFTLRYCNYGGLWYRARKRKWLFLGKEPYEPVDVLDLACYIFGENANMQQFTKVVRFLKEDNLLVSRGALKYANEICSSYFGAGIVFMIHKYWRMFYLLFVALGILALPGRIYAGILNGLFIVDGLFDFLGSSNLRSGVKFALWGLLWTADRIFTPRFTEYTPLMSMGLMFIRCIMVITAFRCASNKILCDHDYIRISGDNESLVNGKEMEEAT